MPHTLGPWRIEGRHMRHNRTIRSDASPLVIADCGKINAPLIAAAPDLLRALEAVSEAMLQGGDGSVGDFGWSMGKLNAARPLIRVALAKARGQA